MAALAELLVVDVWGFVSRPLVPSQDDGHGDAVEGLKCFIQKQTPF